MGVMQARLVKANAATTRRRVHPLLVFGIIFVPYVFALGLLGRGYSTAARIGAFLWATPFWIGLLSIWIDPPPAQPPTIASKAVLHSAVQTAPSSEPQPCVIGAEAANPNCETEQQMEFDNRAAHVRRCLNNPSGWFCGDVDRSQRVIVLAPTPDD